MPDRSPFTSATKHGTPLVENPSMMPCSVTVLPVPVAPAISPWRLARFSSSDCRLVVSSELAPMKMLPSAMPALPRCCHGTLPRGSALRKPKQKPPGANRAAFALPARAGLFVVVGLDLHRDEAVLPARQRDIEQHLIAARALGGGDLLAKRLRRRHRLAVG